MESQDLRKQQSIFLDETKKTNYPKLEKDMEVDLAIVGGGMVGITLAFLLRNSKQKVVVIEADRIAMGTSLHTTGKVTMQHNLIYHQLVHQKTPGKAKQYALANLEATQFIDEVVEKEKINCDLVKVPSYVYTAKEELVRAIQDEVETCKRLNLDVTLEKEIPINIDIKAAIKLEGAGIFNARKYLLSLAELFITAGGEIFEESPVIKLSTHEKLTLETRNSSKIYPKKIIIASHYPMYDGLGFYFTKLNPQRSYIVAAKVAKEELPQGSFISLEKPTRSIRPVYDKNMVLIGGEGHKTGNDPDEGSHYKILEAFAKEVFNKPSVAYYWSTQDYVTPDGVPYVGLLNSKRSQAIYVATGFNKWGMTGGTSAALILKDMLLIGKSPYEEVFNPQRIDSYTNMNFLKENLQVAKSYLGGKLKSVPEEIMPPKGMAVTTRLEDGNVYGVYHDEEGHYHIVDITCPHFGCELRWNGGEKTWDCPCHGSRYSIDGDILEGPSTYRLHSYKEGKNKVHMNILS